MRHNLRRGYRISLATALAAGTLLAACSDTSEEAAYEGESVDAAMEMAEATGEMADLTASADAEAAAGPSGPIGSQVPSGDIPLTTPKIAYVYRYGFRLPGDSIAALQQEHADLCERQGPYSCRILSMDHSGEAGEYAGGTLHLAVAAGKAREFGALLTPEAEKLDGEQVTHSIEGEDLSKAIVDTEARLQARTVLRDRLLEVLRTRRGTVAELVEAERSVAQVNEEIDQARGWIEEMKTRVAFTRMDIAYESGTPVASDFLSPIKGAVNSLGSIFGFVIAALIMLAAVALPIGAVVIGGRAINRRFGRKDMPAEA